MSLIEQFQCNISFFPVIALLVKSLSNVKRLAGTGVDIYEKVIPLGFNCNIYSSYNIGSDGDFAVVMDFYDEFQGTYRYNKMATIVCI